MRTEHRHFLQVLGICSMAVLFFGFPARGEGMDVMISGAWYFRPQEMFWSSPDPVLESSPGSAVIHVVNSGGTREPWRLEVRRQGAPLPGGIILWIRRSGSGHGTGWIRDGLGFIPVGERPGSLFSGAGDRMQVPLQIRISGFTPRTPAVRIRSALLFTVVRLR